LIKNKKVFTNVLISKNCWNIFLFKNFLPAAKPGNIKNFTFIPIRINQCVCKIMNRLSTTAY